MLIENFEPTSSLAPTFEAARNQLSQLSRQAAQLHEIMQVSDEKSRAIFNALSRLLAMSDQIDLVMSLMREDVRVVDELSADSQELLWAEQFGDKFQQWLRAPRAAAPKIH